MRTSLVALLYAAVALFFAAPMLAGLENWGALDWDFQLHQHAASRISLVDYGELPFWNPYNRSGVPLLAHPESRVLAPLFGLHLLLGELLALKLEIVLHLLLGMLGTHVLLRHYGVRTLGATAGAFCFMLSSAYALHVMVGHIWALSFAFLPWVLLLQRLAWERLHRTLLLSAVMVAIIFSGAPYQFMIAWALLGAQAGFSLLLQREPAGRHALLLGLVLVQVLLLGAVKLIPTQALMSQYSRTTASESGYSPAALGNALFDPDQTLEAARAERPEEFNGTPLHEGMYVGFTALALFALGVATRAREQKVLLASLLLFVWIALGQHAPIDLWSLIHRLPGYDNMRLVQRFGVVALLLGSIFVGFGLQRLDDELRRRLGERAARIVAIGAVALLFIELQLVSRPILAETFPIPPLEVVRHAEFEQHRRMPSYDALGWALQRRALESPALTSLYPAVLANRGSTIGYEIVPIASSATPVSSPAYRGEVYLDGEAPTGAARFDAWSPNHMRIRLTGARAGDILVVNQNYVEGWQADVAAGERREARNVSAREGLISLKCRSGDELVELRYRPPGFTLGWIVSSLSAAGFVGWSAGPALARRFRRARR